MKNNGRVITYLIGNKSIKQSDINKIPKTKDNLPLQSWYLTKIDKSNGIRSGAKREQWELKPDTIAEDIAELVEEEDVYQVKHELQNFYGVKREIFYTLTARYYHTTTISKVAQQRE